MPQTDFSSKMPRPFCNRKKELEQLLAAARSAQNVTVFSLPGMGKTALCQKFLSLLPNDILGAYIPLSQHWISPRRDPETVLAAAILQAAVKACQHIGSFLPLIEKFRPEISFDDAGNTTARFSATSKLSIIEVLETWDSFVSHYFPAGGVLLYDDFDLILDEKIERILRATIQHTYRTAHMFFMRDNPKAKQVFFGKNNPFFRSGSAIFLEPLEKKDLQQFIVAELAKEHTAIQAEQIDKILEMASGSPTYITSLISLLSLCSEVTDRQIDTITATFDEQYTTNVKTLLEGLSPSQRALLIALSDVENAKPFSSEFITRFDLKAASTVQRSLEALINRDLVTQEDDGSVSIKDTLLRRKLRETVNSNPLLLD